MTPSVGTPPASRGRRPRRHRRRLAGRHGGAAERLRRRARADGDGRHRTVKTGEATSIAGVQGKATVQQVVEAVMAAEQTLQAGVAIRDKVVSAYLEISRMSI